MKVLQIFIKCVNCKSFSNANYKAKDKVVKTDCRVCGTKLIKQIK